MRYRFRTLSVDGLLTTDWRCFRRGRERNQGSLNVIEYRSSLSTIKVRTLLVVGLNTTEWRCVRRGRECNQGSLNTIEYRSSLSTIKVRFSVDGLLLTDDVLGVAENVIKVL